MLLAKNNNVFDTFFGDPWFNDPWFDDRDIQKAEKKLYGHNDKKLMLTDIKESDKGYELGKNFLHIRPPHKHNFTIHIIPHFLNCCNREIDNLSWIEEGTTIFKGDNNEIEDVLKGGYEVKAEVEKK